MGGYRDDREVERARIEALERDLADANERAARAEAEAAAARAKASEAERAATAGSPRTEAGPKKSRAQRKREKAQREAVRSAQASAAPGPWPRERRKIYFGASYALALAAYLTVAVSVFMTRGEDLVTPSAAIAFCIAIAALIVGHLLIGRVTRAPSALGGAMITLLSSSVSLGGAVVAVVAIADVAESFAPGRPVPLFVHAIGVIVTLVLGSLVTAFWSSDAASSPMSSD